jgi:hypothetical protein
MLRNRSAALAFAALLTLGGYAALLSVSSTPQPVAQPSCTGKNHQKDKCAVDNDPSPFRIAADWAERNDKPILALTAIGALIAAFILTFVTGGLWRATKKLATETEKLGVAEHEQSVEMRRANEIAERNFDLAEKQFLLAGRQCDLAEKEVGIRRSEFFATHRPRIRVGYIRIGPLIAGTPPSVEIWALNIGDGDAEITELGADIFVRRIDTPGTAVFGATPAPYPGIPPVAPGGQANINVAGGRILRQEEIDGINGAPNMDRAPWLHLCALGTIHYLDTNRTRRITSFFRIYNPDRLRFMGAPEDDEYAEWDYEA